MRTGTFVAVGFVNDKANGDAWAEQEPHLIQRDARQIEGRPRVATPSRTNPEGTLRTRRCPHCQASLSCALHKGSLPWRHTRPPRLVWRPLPAPWLIDRYRFRRGHELRGLA